MHMYRVRREISPGVIIRCGGLGVWDVFSCRYKVWPFVSTYSSSVLVHAHTISLHPLSFSSMTYLQMKNLHFSCLPWRIIPSCQPPPGTTRALKISDSWTAWGVHQIKTVSSKNWEYYDLGTHSTLVPRFHCTQQLQNTVQAVCFNSTGDICWLDSPRWNYHRPLVFIAFHRSFAAGMQMLLLAVRPWVYTKI